MDKQTNIEVTADLSCVYFRMLTLLFCTMQCKNNICFHKEVSFAALMILLTPVTLNVDTIISIILY